MIEQDNSYIEKLDIDSSKKIETLYHLFDQQGMAEKLLSVLGQDYIMELYKYMKTYGSDQDKD